MIQKNSNDPNKLNWNRAAILLTLIAMFVIAGQFDYRLKIDMSGINFERNPLATRGQNFSE